MPPAITSSLYGNGCSRAQTRTIAVNAPNIEPRDTIRETATTAPKTAAAPKPTGHDIASSTPRPVAADLPPAKFSQIERACPSSAASPARQTAQGSNVWKSITGGTDSLVMSQG